MNVKKLCIGFILAFAFVLIFNQIFDLKRSLMFLFPEGAFDYPRPKNVNSNYVFFLKLLLSLIIPVIVSVFFIIKSKLLDKLAKNWGLTLLTTVVLIYLARYGLLYASTFIRGGGPTYVLAVLFSYLNVPLKLMLIIALLKTFLSLSEDSEGQIHISSDKISFLILILGLNVFLSTLLDPMTRFGTISRFRFSTLGFLFPIIYFTIAFAIVYKTEIYKKVTDNYGIYLLGISTLLHYANIFFIRNFYKKFPDFYQYGIVFVLLLKLAIIIALLKICLTLKGVDRTNHLQLNA